MQHTHLYFLASGLIVGTSSWKGASFSSTTFVNSTAHALMRLPLSDLSVPSRILDVGHISMEEPKYSGGNFSSKVKMYSAYFISEVIKQSISSIDDDFYWEDMQFITTGGVSGARFSFGTGVEYMMSCIMK